MSGLGFNNFLKLKYEIYNYVKNIFVEIFRRCQKKNAHSFIKPGVELIIVISY